MMFNQNRNMLLRRGIGEEEENCHASSSWFHIID